VITTGRTGGSELVDERSGEVVPEPGDADALAGALRTWIERVRAGEIDREHIRGRVAHRDVAPWLAKLETLALELARRPEHLPTGERP
jgi:glycosyltransferase involved in cell wall biosynthesis